MVDEKLKKGNNKENFLIFDKISFKTLFMVMEQLKLFL